MRILAVLGLVLLGCDSADWEPAKGADEYARIVGRAYRVRNRGELGDCPVVELGTVRAETNDPIPAIAITAARHGATHYFIYHDDEDSELVDRSFGVSSGGPYLRTTSTVHRVSVETVHAMSAHAYRAPDCLPSRH